MRKVRAAAGMCGMLALVLSGCSRPDTAPVGRSAAPLPSVAMASSMRPVATTTQTHAALPVPAKSAAPSTSTRTADGSAGTASIQVSTPSGAEQKTAPNTFLIECDSSNLVSEPTSFLLACGDGNASLTNMKWSNWGASVAHASGVLVENSCDPSCAEGSPKSYDVTVTADVLGARAGDHVYENLTVTFTGTMPADAEKVTKYPMLH